MARSVVERVEGALLRKDSDVMRFMFEEFGRASSIEHTLKLWKTQHDPHRINERVLQLHVESLSRTSRQCILAEGWMYHLRSHRQSLYEAIRVLGYANPQFALVEFRLPKAVTIDRMRARKGKAESNEFSNWPRWKQRRHAENRIRNWINNF